MPWGNEAELGLWWLVGWGSRESGGGEEDWMGQILVFRVRLFK